MKRCPQCEFIYEDDQTLCDMDGILLVFDSQNLPKPRSTRKSHRRSRIVPLVAMLVLTTVLSLVYYVSTHQRKIVRDSDATVVVNEAKPAESANQVTSEPEKKVIAAEPVPEPKPPAIKPPADTELKKPAKSNQKKTGSNQTKEKDSKIESFVKKTGRLLKKPFKL
jgi:hypothetical protein